MKTENGAMPKKNMLSLQIDLSKFEPATEEEKAQHEIQRESTTFFRDGMRKLFKNPLAVGSMIVLLVLLVTIVVAPIRYGLSIRRTSGCNSDVKDLGVIL